MAKGRREIPPCSKTYGFPIYCAAWVPFAEVAATAAPPEANEKDGNAGVASGGEGGELPMTAQEGGNRLLVALGGGGGEGRSGIPNALVISSFDLLSQSLSDQPVFRMGTDADVPYRMAVHPKGEGVICSFPKSCRWFKWEFSEGKEPHNLTLKSPGEAVQPLENVGLQLALSFNAEGSIFATGGEDGHLKVFKWPTMEDILEESDANTTLKDLDFSSDGKFLVSLRNSGPCRVWDLTSSSVVANLPREAGEIFGFCRFSRGTGSNALLFLTAMHGDQGKIISWNTVSWKRVGSKRIVRDPISAFNVSPDGKLLAVGTIEGSILIMNSTDMKVQTTVRKAHLGIVTALIFSHDSRALLSSSFDSTARVTIIGSKKSNGSSIWLMVLVIIVAILLYYIRLKAEP